MTKWHELNAKLRKMNERRALALLNKELTGERRASYLVRMHQRYAALRTMREREALLRKGTL